MIDEKFQEMFPEEFDYDYYTSEYHKGINLDYTTAKQHFLGEGKKLGYAGCEIADRKKFIAHLKKLPFNSILEIGPGVSPAFKGENVSYFDVRIDENFRDYAIQKGVKNLETLPEITFYSDDGRLNNIDRKFDLIFSSHCIEHVFCLITHLNEVSELLNDNGLYCCVVPDKRFTFDYFKNVSDLSNALAIFYDESKFHRSNTYFQTLLHTHNDHKRHWEGDHGTITFSLESKNKIEQIHTSFKKQFGQNSGMHAHIFTDESFLVLLQQLHAIGLIKLFPYRVYNTKNTSNSFCVVLKNK